jgi:hypothetical protein
MPVKNPKKSMSPVEIRHVDEANKVWARRATLRIPASVTTLRRPSLPTLYCSAN